jgi:hypothetical protein
MGTAGFPDSISDADMAEVSPQETVIEFVTGALNGPDELVGDLRPECRANELPYER